MIADLVANNNKYHKIVLFGKENEKFRTVSTLNLKNNLDFSRYKQAQII